jgi:hypothetical protein
MLLALLLTQAAPPPPSKVEEQVVHTRGCLQGTTLLLTEDPGFEVPNRKIAVQGSRSMMRRVKEHDGHHVEVVAVLKAGRVAAAYKEKRDKKTRVYVGASQGTSPEHDDVVTMAPVLNLRELTDIAPKCPVNRQRSVHREDGRAKLRFRFDIDRLPI